MDKFRSFTIKAFITLACTTSVIVYERYVLEKSFRWSLAIGSLAAVLFDFVVMSYFYTKKLEYRKRFLRKVYEPGYKTLVSVVVCEILVTTPFYYFSKYWKVFVVNVGSILVFSMLLVFGSKGRRAIQLERNEEFFKIGFLRTEHVENGEVCLNKGEVVQILDHNGGNMVVRKSSGRVFEINESYIDDGIDIVL